MTDQQARMPADADPPELIDEALVTAAYNLLLKEPGLDMAQFAQRLSCPDEEAKSILDLLVSLSLLNRQTTEYGTMVTVSPIVAMQRLIAREQALLSQRHQALDQSYGAISAIMANYACRPGSVDDDRLAEPLADLPTVRRRLEELASGAQDEVLSFNPIPDNPTATRAASRPLDMTALNRGVTMRTIYTDNLAFEPAALEYAREVVAAGGEVRTLPDVPMRMIIVDRRTAVIPRDPDDSGKGALVIRQRTLVLALLTLFDSCWQHGRPLHREQVGPGECSSAERAIVRLLATGAKDDSVARQLGTSVRTVRRVIAELMERASADSRFALGVYAAAHEWL